MTDTQVATVKLAHFSMLFSSSKKQVSEDAHKIFSRGYDWITGTEAGQAPVLPTLKAFAQRYGYVFTAYKSNWVAIRRDLIAKHSFVRGGVTVVDNDDVVGHGHDMNVCWSQFDNSALGHVTVMASHYATRGRPDGDRSHRVNVKVNRELAQKIGDMGDVYGKGSSLVFYGGDQNIVDRDNDTFFGEGFTSAWDELDKYEGTGHGNIDVIASYNKDGRVEAAYIRALDDRELKMNTDHFPVEAGFDVELLNQA